MASPRWWSTADQGRGVLPGRTHYFSHAAWLEEGVLLREASRLEGIPGVLIHGRLDLGGPVATAWELARAWPGAELMIVEDAGHTGSPAMHQQVYAAIERCAAG